MILLFTTVEDHAQHYVWRSGREGGSDARAHRWTADGSDTIPAGKRLRPRGRPRPEQADEISLRKLNRATNFFFFSNQSSLRMQLSLKVSQTKCTKQTH